MCKKEKILIVNQMIFFPLRWLLPSWSVCKVQPIPEFKLNKHFGVSIWFQSNPFLL